MAVTKFTARQGTCKIFAGQVTFDASTALDEHSSPAPTTIITLKNVTVSPPEGAVEQVPLLGETAQTIGAGVISTGTMQNAVMDEKNFTNAKLTATMILTGDEQFELLGLGGGTAINATHTRYMFGDSSGSNDRIVNGLVVVNLDNGNEEINAGYNNAYVTKLGDIKPTSAEGGHWEQEIELECLPADFALEFKD